MNFIFWLNTKFSRDLFVTSWACTIGIWSKLTQLNLMRQIYAICYNNFWWLFNSIKKGIENRGVLNLNGKRYHDIFHILNIKTKAINIEVNFRRFWCIDNSIFFNVLNRVVWKHEDFFSQGAVAECHLVNPSLTWYVLLMWLEHILFLKHWSLMNPKPWVCHLIWKYPGA